MNASESSHQGPKRSTTGCLTCGVRAKKCDETWKDGGCQRCRRLRIECVRIPVPRTLSNSVRKSQQMKGCIRQIAKAVKYARKGPGKDIPVPLPSVHSLAKSLLVQGDPSPRCNSDGAELLPMIPGWFTGSEFRIQPEQPEFTNIAPETNVPVNTFDPFDQLSISPEASGAVPSSHFLQLPDIRSRLLDCKKRILPLLSNTLGCCILPEADSTGAPGTIDELTHFSPSEYREDDIQLAQVIEGVVLGLSIMTDSLGSRVIWGPATDPTM